MCNLLQVPFNPWTESLYDDTRAGQDTTAASLSWAVKFFTLYPEMQKKLHEALVQAFDITEPRVLTYDEVANRTVPYLDAVVYEILRLAHVAPVVSRQSEAQIIPFHHLRILTGIYS